MLVEINVRDKPSSVSKLYEWTVAHPGPQAVAAAAMAVRLVRAPQNGRETDKHRHGSLAKAIVAECSVLGLHGRFQSRELAFDYGGALRLDSRFPTYIWIIKHKTRVAERESTRSFMSVQRY